MIKGRKCRNNTKAIAYTSDAASPKRKDIKLSMVSTAKTEMATIKKPENVYRKSNRNKREPVTSPTIMDFFQPKTDETPTKKGFVLKSKESNKTLHIIDGTFEIESECSTEITDQKVYQSIENLNSNSEDIMISTSLDDNKQQSSSKPVTPHRIVCLSPFKEKSASSVVPVLNDNKIPTRNKKKLDLGYRENSSEETSIVQTFHTDGKKQVLNSSANPSARQNTKNNKITEKQDDTNKKLTDFFPIRRSVRKTNKEVQQDILRSYEKAIIEQSEDGLEVKYFENKGRGVVAIKPFQKNEFVLEYIGELISMAEANEREVKYAKDENTGCYMYYFKYSGQQFCIDATEETGKLGRLVNHSRNGNLITKTIAVKQKPHLILVAKNDITPGTELTYDYGDRSKESLTHHPWLAF